MHKNLHISDLILYKESSSEIIEFLEKNKIENIELFIEPLDVEYTKKMLEILNNYKFNSLSFHGPFRKCRLTDNTDKGWSDTIKSYEESFKIAKNYNTEFMVLHSNEGVDGIVDKKDIENKIKYLVELGKNYGIDVVVENVGIKSNMIFNQEDYENLILKNNYSSLIDIGHAYLNNWDLEKLLKNLKKNIKGFHFHNNDNIKDEHKSISTGKIPYLEVIDLYKKYTPTTKIVLEYDFKEDKDQLLKDIRFIEANID